MLLLSELCPILSDITRFSKILSRLYGGESSARMHRRDAEVFDGTFNFKESKSGRTLGQLFHGICRAYKSNGQWKICHFPSLSVERAFCISWYLILIDLPSSRLRVIKLDNFQIVGGNIFCLIISFSTLFFCFCGGPEAGVFHVVSGNGVATLLRERSVTSDD